MKSTGLNPDSGSWTFVSISFKTVAESEQSHHQKGQCGWTHEVGYDEWTKWNVVRWQQPKLLRFEISKLKNGNLHYR